MKPRGSFNPSSDSSNFIADLAGDSDRETAVCIADLRSVRRWNQACRWRQAPDVPWCREFEANMLLIVEPMPVCRTPQIECWMHSIVDVRGTIGGCGCSKEYGAGVSLDALGVREPLSAVFLNDVRAVARGYLSKLTETVDKAGKTITIDDDALELIAAEGYSVAFGARFLKRVIDERIKLPLTMHWNSAARFRVRATRRGVAVEAIAGGGGSHDQPDAYREAT